MDAFIHADVFFFVTTVAVIIVGVFMVIALVYFIKILNQIRRTVFMLERFAARLARFGSLARFFRNWL